MSFTIYSSDQMSWHAGLNMLDIMFLVYLQISSVFQRAELWMLFGFSGSSFHPEEVGSCMLCIDDGVKFKDKSQHSPPPPP
jgi:hypothetical protein